MSAVGESDSKFRMIAGEPGDEPVDKLFTTGELENYEQGYPAQPRRWNLGSLLRDQDAKEKVGQSSPSSSSSAQEK